MQNGAWTRSWSSWKRFSRGGSPRRWTARSGLNVLRRPTAESKLRNPLGYRDAEKQDSDLPEGGAKLRCKRPLSGSQRLTRAVV
jgi:hypothetical protein